VEISSLLFALGLFVAGIWLIRITGGDFKEKTMRTQTIPDVQRHSPHATPHVSSDAGGVAVSGARHPSPMQNDSAFAPTAGVERVGPIDRLQDLNAAVVRETFERFTQEIGRTR
jgi:hypothetical protein